MIVGDGKIGCIDACKLTEAPTLPFSVVAVIGWVEIELDPTCLGTNGNKMDWFNYEAFLTSDTSSVLSYKNIGLVTWYTSFCIVFNEFGVVTLCNSGVKMRAIKSKTFGLLCITNKVRTGYF